MRPSLSTIVAFCIAGCVFAVAPATADPKGHDSHHSDHKQHKKEKKEKKDKHGHSYQSEKYERHEHVEHTNVIIVPQRIESPDVVVIREYLRDHHGERHCPPGLAKKRNGCLPPGIAKKYRVGYPLSEDVVYYPVPEMIIERLHPVPGYRYVQVDQDVLLINEATKKVIDAVTLLSAVR